MNFSLFWETIVGKYFLVDAGYTNGPGFLAPYRGTRYHLNEWRLETPCKITRSCLIFVIQVQGM